MTPMSYFQYHTIFGDHRISPDYCVLGYSKVTFMLTIFIYGIKEIDHIIVIHKLLGSIDELQGHLVNISIKIHKGFLLLYPIMLLHTVIPLYF